MGKLIHGQWLIRPRRVTSLVLVTQTSSSKCRLRTLTRTPPQLLTECTLQQRMSWIFLQHLAPIQTSICHGTRRWSMTWPLLRMAIWTKHWMLLLMHFVSIIHGHKMTQVLQAQASLYHALKRGTSEIKELHASSTKWALSEQWLQKLLMLPVTLLSTM